MKGADVVMAGIVQYNDWLEEEVSRWQAGSVAREAAAFALARCMLCCSGPDEAESGCPSAQASCRLLLL